MSASAELHRPHRLTPGADIYATEPSTSLLRGAERTTQPAAILPAASNSLLGMEIPTQEIPAGQLGIATLRGAM
eukprot:2940304-Alexandrium_andersonii.AAC.1